MPLSDSQAADAVEEALRAQAETYRSPDGDDGGMVMVGWLGLTAWAGVDDHGETSRLVLHLRDGALSTWQLIGLLRAELLVLEQTYAQMGNRGHNSD